MTSVTLVSVGRGPLTLLLEHWWVTVDVIGGEYATARVRLSVEWSPWTARFTVNPEDAEILAVGEGVRPPDTEELVDVFTHSPAQAEAFTEIRRFARRFQKQLPERVARLELSR